MRERSRVQFPKEPVHFQQRKLLEKRGHLLTPVTDRSRDGVETSSRPGAKPPEKGL